MKMAPKTKEGPSRGSVYEEGMELLIGSVIIYIFAELRAMVRDGSIRDLTLNDLEPPLTASQTLALIQSHKDALKERALNHEYLESRLQTFQQAYDSKERKTTENSPFSLTCWVDFILCGGRPDKQRDSSNTIPSPSESEKNAMVLKRFVDHNSQEELVHGVVINPIKKRITIIFRGSVTNKDFLQDVKCAQLQLENPVLKIMSNKNPTEEQMPSKIRIHTGFHEYLFYQRKDTETTRLQEILDDAKALLRENPGFSLYLTGHSLGGALSTLCGFYAACDEELIQLAANNRVVVYSIASPFCGNWKFRHAFQELERQRRLQHLRIANLEDMVTLLPFAVPKAAFLSPALSMIQGAGNLYKHVGIKVQLKKITDAKGHEVVEHSIQYPMENQTGVEMMEASGRFLFDQLVSSSIITKNNKAGVTSSSILDIQIIADQASQRDLDSALALLRGIRYQSLNGTDSAGSTRNSEQKIQVKGLDRVHFIPALFHQWDDLMDMCENKLLTSHDFQQRVREEIQHRLNSIPPPEPGLALTLEKIESLAGQGKFGPLTEIPTLVDETKTTTTTTISSSINASSPFPAMVSDKAMYLAGPVNIVKWFAEMAFYSRAGGVSKPFLPNATLTDIYKLVEWYDWSRTILSVENSIAASKGSVMAKAILDALTYGNVPYAADGLCSRESKYHDHDDDDDSSTTKVTFIIGHDGNMDDVATSLGLHWQIDHMSHEAPSTPEHEQVGKYIPTPPGSAMHFAVDNEGTVTMDFWYPVYLEPHKRNAQRVPTGMQHNTSGILERTPIMIKARSDSIQKQMKAKLSVDKKHMILSESGIEVLHDQLEATLERFPDARDCYDSFLKHSMSKVIQQDSCHAEPLVKGILSQQSQSATIIGIVGGCLVTLLIVVCWNLYRRQHEEHQQKLGAIKVSTCEPVSNEVDLELVSA